MPPLPPVAQVIKCAISGTCDTFTWANALHFGYSGGAPGNTDMVSLATLIGAAWNDTMSPFQDTVTSMLKVETTDLTSPLSAQGVQDFTTPGLRAGAFLPADACLLINYPITRRYRGGHPRQYLSVGIQTDLLDRAHWEGSFVVAVHAAWQAFIAEIVGQIVGTTTIESQGCVSYVSVAENPIYPNRRAVPLYEAFTPSDNSASAELASQRRRIGRK